MHIKSVTNDIFFKQTRINAKQIKRNISSVEKNCFEKDEQNTVYKYINAVLTLIKKCFKIQAAKYKQPEEYFVSGRVINPEEYAKLKVIDYEYYVSEGVYVASPDCVTHSAFTEKFNPVEIEVTNDNMNSLHIAEDVYPKCSVAVSSLFNQALSTDHIYQCAAAGFVDKSKGIQTLFHCSPFTGALKNRAILEYILSYSKPDDLDIFIIPGFYTETGVAIDFLIKNIKDINEKYKIEFLNFKDSINNAVVLKNGQIMSCNGYNLKKSVNPKDRIIYAV